MTPDELRKLQRTHERAMAKVEQTRAARNAAVIAALDGGWSHEALSHALGISRGRISQIRRQDDIRNAKQGTRGNFA